MSKNYDFDADLEYYKSIYMDEGFDEEDAETMSVHLMEACNIDTSQYYEQTGRA